MHLTGAGRGPWAEAPCCVLATMDWGKWELKMSRGAGRGIEAVVGPLKGRFLGRLERWCPFFLGPSLYKCVP